jgi:hypothetical protein
MFHNQIAAVVKYPAGYQRRSGSAIKFFDLERERTIHDTKSQI